MPQSLYALLGLSLLLSVGCGSTRLAAQPLPSPAPEAPHFDLPDLERRVIGEINRVRREHGRSSLIPDSALDAIARAHSTAMLGRGFFAHRDPEGRRGGDRAREAGYPFRHFGENLFRGRLYDTLNHWQLNGRTAPSYLWYAPDELAALAVATWMESDGHRRNMLSSSFDTGGVGGAVGPDFEVFVTLNLSAL